MANNRLILRTLTSPWVSPTDLTKNSVLSHEDVDNNFIYLRGEAIKSAGFSSGNVVLTKVNGETITVPTGAGANTFVTGGTYDANTSIITLTRNDNVSINIGGLTDTVVTAFTYDNANSITLSQNQGEPDQVVLINTMSGLTVTGTLTANTIDASNILSGGTNLNDIFATTIAASSGDTYVTGFTYDNANNITLSQNEGQADKVINISTMTGLTVTGTMSGTTVLADNILSGGTNITNIFQTISGASSANTYVTGFTYDNSNNITLSQTNGEPDQVVTIDTVSGLTVNGTLTATTINAGDILSGGTNLNDIFQTLASVTQVNLATDDLVQDAEPRSYNMNNNNLTFSNGYFTVTDSTFGDIVNLNHSGGELFFGGASGVGTGGSNFIHDTKFNVASSTTNCHRDFLNNVGLCLQNYTTTGGLNHYAVVSNNDGPLYVLTSSGNDLLFRSGSDDFIWQNNSGGTEMRLDAGIISLATWEGVTVKEGFGGTAQSSYTTGDMLYASATNTLSKLGAGSEFEILTMVGGVPVWAPNVASGNSLTTGATVIGNTIYFDRNDALSAYTADLSGIVPTGLTTDNIGSGTTNFFVTDGDKGDVTVSNSGTTWTVNDSALKYTTGTTLVGATLYFDRNDALSAYTADLSSISGGGTGTTITDGNGTVANGTSVDLGGILSQETTISGASQNINFGTASSQLTSFNVDAVQGTRTYSVGTQWFTANENPGGYTAQAIAPSNGQNTQFDVTPSVVGGTIYSDSGDTTVQFSFGSGYADINTRYGTRINNTDGSLSTIANLLSGSVTLDVNNTGTGALTDIDVFGGSLTANFSNTGVTSTSSVSLSQSDLVHTISDTITNDESKLQLSKGQNLFYTKDTTTNQDSRLNLTQPSVTLRHTDGSTVTTDLFLSDNNFILKYLSGGTTTSITGNENALLLDGGDTINIAIGTSGGLFSDSRTGTTAAGFEYAANYHAGYTNRSMVDKEYVDNITLTADNGINITTGNTIQLGGILTQNTTISGASNTIDFGTASSQLGFFNINTIQGSRVYSVPTQSYTATENPGGYVGLATIPSNGQNVEFQITTSAIVGTAVGNSGDTTSKLVLNGEGLTQLTNEIAGVTSGVTGFIFTTGGDYLFVDSRTGTTAAGFEYAANYHAGYTNRSMVDKEYVDNAITGVSATDRFTTGATVIGNTVYYDRTDSLSAYTIDLSTLVLTDSNAIHDNVNSEISAITGKTGLTDTDIFLIEDSADSNAKKKTTLEDIKDAVGSASGGTPGIQTAVENFYIATANNQAATSGSQYSSKVIPLVNRTVSNMAYFVASASASKTVYVGIYDNAGNKLAEGSGNTDSTGVQTATLNTSVTLNANTEYFFSILEGSGTPNFAQTSTFGIDKLARSLFISTTPSGLATSIAGHTAATSSFWLKAF